MPEERVIHGRWRLPNWRPQRGVSGTLTLDADGFRLELDGTLLTTKALQREVRHTQRPAWLPRILGFVDDTPKQPVTLDDCAYAGGSHSSNIWVGETSRDQYWPRVVALGAWFEHREPLVVDVAYVSFSSLNPWTVESGFDPNWGIIAPTRRGYVQRYKPPRERRATLADGTVIKLRFPLREVHEGLYTHQKTFTQATRFELHFPEPRGIADVRKLVFMLRNFLSLGVGESVRVTSLHGYRKPQPDESPPIGREFEIRYEHIENPRAREVPHHHDMVFTLADLGGSFRRSMRRWFDGTHDIGLVLDLYFSLLHISSSYLETRFMNYTQAIEGYHRRRLNRTTYPAAVFDTHKAAIIDDLHGDQRRLAKRALRWANEISLEQRIRDVLDFLGDSAVEILASGKSTPEKFAARVASIRNGMAHALVGQAPEIDELATLVLQLQALVEAVLLRQIGFAEGQVTKMLTQAKRLRRIRGY